MLIISIGPIGDLKNLSKLLDFQDKRDSIRHPDRKEKSLKVEISDGPQTSTQQARLKETLKQWSAKL